MGGMNSLRTLRLVAILEATSFLALLVATYFKHAEEQGTGVSVLGPIHGILFLSYVYLAWTVRQSLGWDGRTTALVLLGAVVPFGGYVVDRVYLAEARAV
jgi:integral membrane protein